MGMSVAIIALKRKETTMSEMIKMYNYVCEMRDENAAQATEQQKAAYYMYALLARAYAREIEAMA